MLRILAPHLEIRKKIIDIKKTLPNGIDIEVAFDRATYVGTAIQEVYKTLIIAFILVVAIIYLFLGNLKAVIVPAIALPVSLIASFLGLYLFGLSINIFVLLSFILVIKLMPQKKTPQLKKIMLLQFL